MLRKFDVCMTPTSWQRGIIPTQGNYNVVQEF